MNQHMVKQLNISLNTTVAQPLTNFAGPSQVGSTVARNHQCPMSASMASMNMNTSMCPSNEARLDASNAHQCTNNILAWMLMLVYHPQDLPNLAALHGNVN